MRPLHRIMPKLPVDKMRTYRVAKPRSTHTRPATCQEVDCPQWMNGWLTILPVDHVMVPALRRAAMQAVDLGDGRRRKCVVDQEDAATITFRFEAGQVCLKASEHRVSLQRPEIYLVRGGDWRANLGLVRRHTRPEHWVEDMQETLADVERRLT